MVPDGSARLVTVVVGVVVALTFLFGFVRHEALCFEWGWKTFAFSLSQQVDCS
ncbi:hypothetical protein [Pseudofrankia saprophytica]|uniref:hypothetical protein n=1 Tax=Pseudofrankia saprophytica TaxID=298655 RepID=UPI00030178F3|nr:hypothetical protein [Pseudofrankia saprophytica]